MSTSLVLQKKPHQGRGVYAKEAIPKGELIATIPDQRLLTSRHGERSFVGVAIEASGNEEKDIVEQLLSEVEVEMKPTCSYRKVYGDLTEQEKLGLFLMQDMRRGSASSFSTYYGSLPESFDDFALFMGPGELRSYQGAALLETILPEVRKTVQQFPLLKECAGDKGKDWKLSEWLYVHATVNSRNFLNSDTLEPTLAPLVDMLNHNAKNVNIKVFFTSKGLQIETMRAIVKGEQLMFTYGDGADHTKFLSLYGFIEKPPHGTSVCSINHPILSLAYKVSRHETVAVGIKFSTVGAFLEKLLEDTANRLEPLQGDTSLKKVANVVMSSIRRLKAIY